MSSFFNSSAIKTGIIKREQKGKKLEYNMKEGKIIIKEKNEITG